LSSISWQEQVNFQWDDDEVRFVLDQHTELDFYSASSLKQQSVGRHIAPLWHIILIPSQPVFVLSPWCCMLSGEATNTNFIVFSLTRPGLEPTSTLTITPPMWLYCGIEIYCFLINDLWRKHPPLFPPLFLLILSFYNEENNLK
jgi:hypothetical protein